jgi:hypothetical protein
MCGAVVVHCDKYQLLFQCPVQFVQSSPSLTRTAGIHGWIVLGFPGVRIQFRAMVSYMGGARFLYKKMNNNDRKHPVKFVFILINGNLVFIHHN